LDSPRVKLIPPYDGRPAAKSTRRWSIGRNMSLPTPKVNRLV
jgi:hypothetical protein